MNDTAETIGRLEALIGSEGVSEDHVRLRIGLLRAQAEASRALAALPRVPILAKEKGKGPALHPEMIPLDAAIAGRLFAAVLDVLGTYGDADIGLTWLQSSLEEELGLGAELIRRIGLEANAEYLAATAGRLEIGAELLFFLARILAAPFARHAAGRLREYEVRLPESDGCCPICGSAPALAELRGQQGVRMLHCSLCGHAWQFARLVCPFCGGESQSALHQLLIDDDNIRWIETCKQCKHYLKTIDGRQLPQDERVVPLVESVAGLYLDMIAEREGYEGPPSVAGT